MRLVLVAGWLLALVAGWLVALVAGAPGGFSRAGLRPRPCTHRGDAVNAVGARAARAAHVVVAAARSRSRAPAGGRYAVTFSVERVLSRSPALRPGVAFRVPFRAPRPRPPALCRQTYDTPSQEPVRADIRRGGKYIVFLLGPGPFNFTLLGEPVISKRKNVKAVKDVLCDNCRQAVGVTGLRDMEVKLGDRLKLACKSRGNPLPALSWYKDGQPIKVTKRVRLLYKRKRSKLEIVRVRTDDAGRYECRASPAGDEPPLSSWSSVTVQTPTPANTTTSWPLTGKPCPYESFCLNGGTCTNFEAIGEFVCQCAEGFKGQRCETKDVYNRSNTSPEDWDRALSTPRIMTFY